MISLSCPNCGARNAQEFRFGGEYNPRPAEPMTQDDQAWSEYVYIKDNVSGIQQEWWLHQMGCGAWFLAERHTKTNQVVRTWRWSKDGAS